MTNFDYLIVGAGFAGSILARQLAEQGKQILILDRRSHIAGNAYDYYDKNGILIHKYGPHIFHTNSKEVFEYLSKFTEWRLYQHRVRGLVDGQLVPIPINLDTVNMLYGLDLNSDEVTDFFAARAEKVDKIVTSEDIVVSKVGRELYNKFVKGYTKKQWDLDPSELDSSVLARLPTRTSRDDRYFNDTFQAMPKHGYTVMFENILDHANIKIMLNTDYKEIVDIIPHNHLIYTGTVDSYFDYKLGKLPYRSLDFSFETFDQERVQEVATINYPNDYDFTRATEMKLLTGQEHKKTVLCYEVSQAEGDPYYPIPQPQNAGLYKKYKALADKETKVSFAGRLGTYKYYNMDQVVAQALKLSKDLSE